LLVETISDREALERFVYQNEELEQVESIIDDFNLFRALDLTRYELRHSTFLRWLLDPAETHGLGDYFLKLFLQTVVRKAEPGNGNAPSLFDLDDWDLGQAEVIREWRNIDVLVCDDANKFVCVVENKIDAAEHGDQLRRYYELVHEKYPNYRRLFIYLTAADEEPSHEAYIAFSYRDLAELLDRLVERRRSQLSDEVRLFLGQYLEMVRRYIVEDSQIQELCRRIYKNHRRALDLIFEHRPDRQGEIRDVLVGLLELEREKIEIDGHIKSSIRFIPKTLDFLPRRGEGWVQSGRMLLFVLKNYGDNVKLNVLIGPGDPTIRQRLYDVAGEHPQPFGKMKKLAAKWHQLFGETWLKGSAYTDLDLDEVTGILQEKLWMLLNERVPKVRAAFEELVEEFGVDAGSAVSTED